MSSLLTLFLCFLIGSLNQNQKCLTTEIARTRLPFSSLCILWSFSCTVHLFNVLFVHIFAHSLFPILETFCLWLLDWEYSLQIFVLVRSCWRRVEDVLSVTIFCLSRRLEDVLKTYPRHFGRGKVVTLHYDKNRQPLCDLIRFWLCSTSLQRQMLLIYSHDVPECTGLWGDRI